MAPISGIPAGYAFRAVSAGELRESFRDLNDVWLVYEKPQGRSHGDHLCHCGEPHRYIISADVADGLGAGHDYSSIDVVRMGTIEEPAEQVAHFRTNQTTPSELATIIEQIGRYYVSADGLEALVAIENNNHGLSTQDHLQLHLGYTHFYRWETFDSADPSKRFTRRIGWLTTERTRPILLDHFYHALTRLDPITNLPDLVVNSPHTWGELADFQTDGALWEAEAATGAHDDCVMSLAIGYYIAYRLAGGERQPIAEIRRQRQEEQRQLEDSAGVNVRPDYRNMPFTADEVSEGRDAELLPESRDRDSSLVFSYRGY